MESQGNSDHHIFLLTDYGLKGVTYFHRVYSTLYYNPDLEKAQVDLRELSLVTMTPGDDTWNCLPLTPHQGSGSQRGEGNREVGDTDFCLPSKGIEGRGGG